MAVEHRHRTRQGADGAIVGAVGKSLHATAQFAHDFPKEYSHAHRGPLYLVLCELMLSQLDAKLDEIGVRWLRNDLHTRVFLKPGDIGVASAVAEFWKGKVVYDSGGAIAPADALEVDLWGHALVRTESGLGLTVSEEGWSDFEYQIRQTTQRSHGNISNERRAQNVTRAVGRFCRDHRFARPGPRLAEDDEWLARRLRMIYWKQWKLVRTRINKLEELGVPHERAVISANSRAGFWHASNNPTIVGALNRRFLASQGYTLLADEHARRHERADLIPGAVELTDEQVAQATGWEPRNFG